MNCLLNIKTWKDIKDYEDNLKGYLGNSDDFDKIYQQTSIKNVTYITYFYGRIDEKIISLFAKDTADTLRIFIEGVDKKDNLDQLVTGVKQVFNNVKYFLDKNKMKYSQISATIWSEGEEMLRGEYQDYWTKFKSFIPDIPTGIYLFVLTIIYSIVQPKEGTAITTESGVKSAGINMLIVVLAVLLWLFIKAYNKETNLSFRIK